MPYPLLLSIRGQLPPTITCDAAAQQGLSVTMVDRIAARFADRASVISMLTVQYRMHAAIMTWSSHELYHDKLVADASVSGHLLTDLATWAPAQDGSVDTECLEAPLVLIDTAGCGLEELQVWTASRLQARGHACTRHDVFSRRESSLVDTRLP